MIGIHPYPRDTLTYCRADRFSCTFAVVFVVVVVVEYG